MIMKPYAIYLRKSREDVVAERDGGEDTLARHERMLTELANQREYVIGEIYREVVSGETISGRPEMQRLLRDVEKEKWAGVLVTEVTRLARGDTIDQGVVAQTFKYSGTLIVTPNKIYNPLDRGDEEYFEFGLFMSRREYQMINQRLQNGRIRAVAEGKYPGNKAPYGYSVAKLPRQKGNTLSVVPEEALIVEQVFEWYTSGLDGQRLGTTKIAHRLNELHVPTRTGSIWTTSSIQSMLRNPAYIGMVRWGGRKQVKKMVNGQIVRSRPRNANCILVKGLHEPIIAEDVFKAAQRNLCDNRPSPIPGNHETQNPLAGIIVCGVCGRKMVRRSYQNGRTPSLLCPIAECSNVSSDLDLVEQRLLDIITEMLDQWEISAAPAVDNTVLKEREWLARIDKEIAKAEEKLDTQRDLLEQGVYTVAEYVKRKEKVSAELETMRRQRAEIAQRIDKAYSREQRKRILLPRYRGLLAEYVSADAAGRNAILREIVEKAIYIRKKGGRWCPDKQNFTLEIILRI